MKKFMLLLSLIFVGTYFLSAQKTLASVDEKSFTNSVTDYKSVDGITLEVRPHEYGLLFQKDDLVKVLETKSNIYGIAFKVDPRNISNKGIQVLGVFEKEVDSQETLVGEELNIKYLRDEIKNTKEPKLTLGFTDIMTKSKLSFALITKDQLKLLFQLKSSQLLLSLVELNFGKLRDVNGTYFTFKLETYPSISKNTVPKNTLGIPSFALGLPCPPDWMVAEK